ncbi:hypothetical protein GCM10025883_21610 [Mobilicoccus caccae]|uniref:DUF4439 domain-containing protein n=1 Tax=Mobilicoccus caccae TaxID=1859295 RepID=A0ABQ6IRQ3_9MICO|nr:hypothetical protein GCM10025883_21610 [Mobilicoccus caccae]
MLLATMTLPLAGCGIRFESDAPPFLPDPSPDPAGPPISAERDRVAAIATALVTVDGQVGRRLRPLHEAQLAALDRALARLDPPVTPAPGATPPTAATSPQTPAAGRTDLAHLADLEFVSLDAPGLADLDAVPPRAAEVVVASHTQRAVALHLLRAARVRGGDVLPALPWTAADATLALTLVEAVRSAAYALEIMAARHSPEALAPVLAGIRLLRQVETGLGAGVPELPPRPLGYPLSRPVTTPDQAAALADGALTRLVTLVVAASVPTASALRENDDDAEAGPTPAPDSPTLPPDAEAAPPRPAPPGRWDRWSGSRPSPRPPASPWVVRCARWPDCRSPPIRRPLPRRAPPPPAEPSPDAAGAVGSWACTQTGVADPPSRGRSCSCRSPVTCSVAGRCPARSRCRSSPFPPWCSPRCSRWRRARRGSRRSPPSSPPSRSSPTSCSTR